MTNCERKRSARFERMELVDSQSEEKDNTSPDKGSKAASRHSPGLHRVSSSIWRHWPPTDLALTGHFALETDGAEIGGAIRALLDKNVH